MEHEKIFRHEFNTVVDIGSNRGQFALAARALTDAQIISFEPLPIAAEVYQSLFSEDSRVKLYEVAIGDAPGTANIFLSARDDSSSLLKMTEHQTRNFPGTHLVGAKPVKIGTLDQFIDPTEINSPALLKIDVQGYESQVLSGCADLLHKFDYIYCECSFIEFYQGQDFAGSIIHDLDKFGFRVIGIYNSTTNKHGECLQADFLFSKLGRSELLIEIND